MSCCPLSKPLSQRRPWRLSERFSLGLMLRG
jgi:hypothetical protein